jgi:FkbM family methyltransferase
MFDKLRKLQENGFTPDTVLDIGAHHGHWTSSMRRIYPHSKYYLFEGINYGELGRYNSDTHAKVYNVILNDTNTEVDWYEMRNTGDSIFKEKTHHFTNCTPIKKQTITLDTLITQNALFQDASNILIKIDCQGAEIPILKGATSILAKTAFIVLEMPLFGQYNEGVPTFLEHIQFMDSIGFVPYDILDTHYIHNYNMQIDMCFINKTHRLNSVVNALLL